MIKTNKKAAIELSIGTIVVIVLAMSMLIFGLVLVQKIFKGSIYNVDQINNKVKGEINKLFDEQGQKVVVYLPNNEAELKKGESFGIAFGIRNTVEGESSAGKFTYTIQASNVQKGCQLTTQQADSFLILGSTGNFDLSPGADPVYRIVKVKPSESAPLCEVWYDLKVNKDSQPYDTQFFIIKIQG